MLANFSPPTTPNRERDPPLSQMTEEELREKFLQLRRKNASLSEESALLQAEISALCVASVRFQQNTEIEEDKLANQLLRRLQNEELQKHRFLSMIRREESARQQIMEQIAQVRGQKTELESQVAQEQESLMLQLQKKLVEVVNKKSEVERELLRERREYLEVLSTQLTRIKMGSLDTNENAVASIAQEDTVESGPCCLQESTRETATAGASSLSPQLVTGAKGVTEEGETTNKTPLWTQTFDCGSSETNEAISHLEKQLNCLLRKHAAAVRASSINEALCTELGKHLDSIQQVAFLDRARASKLREELLEAKKRLSGLERQIGSRGPSVTSDISSGLPTPTFSHVRNASLSGRTKEILLAQHRQINNNFHHSYDGPDAGEETHISLPLPWSPYVHSMTARTTASDENNVTRLSMEEPASRRLSTSGTCQGDVTQ